MKLNNRTQNCVECEFMRMYDYGNKIYYCDHSNPAHHTPFFYLADFKFSRSLFKYYEVFLKIS